MNHAPSAARALAASARFGSLATIAIDPAGWPFATLVAVAVDARGRPLLLLSRLAEHTKNLLQCSRASLLIGESADPAAPGAGDLLARARVTLVGECRALTAGAESDEAKACFLAAHPEAEGYASFTDFSMWRLEVASARWVGGFGKMEWVGGGAYAAEIVAS